MKIPVKVLICILAVLLGGCREQIVHDIPESEANRLMARLDTAGILSEKERQADGSWSVAVARSQASDALRYLSASRVLKERPQIESGSSVISSREEQRFRYERALSSALEDTLSGLDNVLEARVHLNLPPLDPLFGQAFAEKVRSSASVMLITEPGFAVTRDEIAALLGGASGVEASNISVLITQVPVQAGAFPRNSLAAEGHGSQAAAGSMDRLSVKVPAYAAVVVAAFLLIYGGALLARAAVRRRSDSDSNLVENV